MVVLESGELVVVFDFLGLEFGLITPVGGLDVGVDRVQHGVPGVLCLGSNFSVDRVQHGVPGGVLCLGRNFER